MLDGGYTVVLISTAKMVQLELKMKPIITLIFSILEERPCTLLRGLLYLIGVVNHVGGISKDKSTALACKLVYLISH